MYLLYVLGCLSFIAILICLIVDLAVNKGITWSLIAGSSCLFADAFIYALSTCKKNKGCIAMAVISIGAFALLSVIQITRYYLIGTGTFWFFRYGAPILLLWLFVLWLPVLAKTFLKWSIWDCIALFLFLVIIGNYATKLITGSLYQNHYKISVIGYLYVSYNAWDSYTLYLYPQHMENNIFCDYLSID